MYYYPILDKTMVWDHLPLYLFLLLLLTFITVFIVIKLKYPFWNTQPVFHSYDFWRYLTKTSFHIQHRYPVKTKYCDFKCVETFDYYDCDEIHKKEFVNLLQCYYIPDDSALFVFNLDNLDAYMTGHSSPSYLSFYKEDFYVNIHHDPSIHHSSVIENIKKPIGCISTRTVNISFFNEPMIFYFWDFICVKREKASKNISRNLIQTQEYRQRQYTMDSVLIDKTEKPILGSIFKKEVDLCEGIVSLVTYTTETFLIKNDTLKKLPHHFVLIEISGENIDLLIDFLEISRKKFQVFGIAEISNLVGLIEKSLLMVYCIQKAKDIYAVYFFRDSRTQYDGKGVLLSFCGSIHNSNSLDLFYMGFLQSIRCILKKMGLFSLLSIENISHNVFIYEKYKMKSYSYGSSNSAYYLYNYVVPKQPFSSSEVFLVF